MKEARSSAISSLTAARLRNAQVGDPPAMLRYVPEGSPLDLAWPTSSERIHLAGRHAELIALAYAISQASCVSPSEGTPTTPPEHRRAHARVSLENIRAACTATSDRRFAEEVCRLNKAMILSLTSHEHHSPCLLGCLPNPRHQ